MEQWLDKYGELPEVISVFGKDFDIEVSNEEMCFVQYLPVWLPDSCELTLPESLEWCRKLILEAGFQEFSVRCREPFYIYLTVKRLHGSGNRDGWHCDGFGTDDINYIWYDKHPTAFYAGDLVSLPRDHSKSVVEMEERLNHVECKEYPCKHLIRMNQSSIHRVNPDTFNELRTFVKISFSDSKYNLKGNAHNYLLDYDWDMVDRSKERNHPIGATK